ncbi:hypothetical protein M3I54_35940 [Paraburkholderia sp. CNPSo 3274]|uniref:hypothetical protein n=1 Tax=unclassified Paraburkholderia TaxID=2615204 RepID=UPI0020B747B1|nr:MULTISPECIES: hypothetical protein [unclassified Paraburkholderia]MCP3712275.1 hypothetical protein [Paraburkholderia sp. CNPSo 3274]MCP3718498.1 hypothetical protein [Paraburkholderia sp. CNPSo 3281]MCP3724665.1 hypothetical protein [Paraburkholderia sp. CNPSo 3272]
MHWHWLARRAAVALACYVVAMLGVALYAAGLQDSGRLLFTAGSVGFAWAVGFLYAVRTAISLLFTCRRMFL